MEVKPVKIFVYKEVKELINKYDCEGLVEQAVENLLIKPYNYVMRLVPNSLPFEYSEAEPITVYLDIKDAIAWENTPSQLKDLFFSAVHEELWPLVFGYAYVIQLEGGKKS